MSLVIGLAGGSGSGKTTVVRRIVESLGGEHVTVLDHDRYYRDHPELRLEERAALNYDHPDSLETDLMVRHVRQLKAGQAIDAPTYDFTLHARASSTERFEPRTALIVEGILVFADRPLRELMDIKIFVDADDDIVSAERDAGHGCCSLRRFDGRSAGRAGRTGLRWDLVRSGSYEVTARPTVGSTPPRETGPTDPGEGTEPVSNVGSGPDPGWRHHHRSQRSLEATVRHPSAPTPRTSAALVRHEPGSPRQPSHQCVRCQAAPAPATP